VEAAKVLILLLLLLQEGSQQWSVPFCVRIKAKGPQGVCVCVCVCVCVVWHYEIQGWIHKVGSKLMTLLHHHPCSNESKILIWKEIKGLAHDVSYLLLHCKQAAHFCRSLLPNSLPHSLTQPILLLLLLLHLLLPHHFH
jgi:hypothetical protein